MFSFPKDKSFLQTAVFLTFVMLLSSGLMFVSCSNDDNSSGNLDGTWDAGYGTVIINTSDKTVVYTGNYEGIIVNSPNYTASSGVLIVQFTKYANWGDPAPSTSHANAGKYGALYWSGLKTGSVKLADAYNQTTYTHVMFNTLVEADAAFTPAADKVGTYVNWSIIAPYQKQ